MGAWGVEPFANDDASDWYHEFERGGRPILDDAFAAIRPDRDIDRRPGAEAVAAAAIVLAAHGRGGADWLEKELSTAPAPFVTELRDPVLVARALAVLALVMDRSRSEFAQLWQESEDGPAWTESMTRLSAELRTLPGGNGAS